MLLIMEANFETISLAIHRVEVIEYRDGEEKFPEVTPFDNPRSAHNFFEGIASKNFKHLLIYRSLGYTLSWTRVELYQNDELVNQIIINAGMLKPFPKKENS